MIDRQRFASSTAPTSPAPRPLRDTRPVLCVAVPLLVCLTSLSANPPSGFIDDALLATSLVAASVVLPSLGRWIYLVCVAMLCAAGWIVNDLKFQLTGMPLTWMDIEVFALQPRASLAALQASAATNVVVLTGGLLAGGALLAGFVFDVLRAPRSPVHAAAFCASLALSALAGSLLADRIDNRLTATSERLLEPKEHRSAQQWAGLGAYLVYTFRLGAGQAGVFLQQSAPHDIDSEAVRTEAARFVRFHPQKLQPNIVAILAESTFDPNRAFYLRDPFRSHLFEASALTHALGPLRVNVIGGGTWTSEFEFFTGLDSRLFGYSGSYAPVMLAPFVKRGFIHRLVEKGYSTTAYYATEGSFMEARRSFRQYGFQRDLDRIDLGFRPNEWLAKDKDIAAAVLRDMADKAEGPFFKYVQLLENHSPHVCAKNVRPDDFIGRFARPASVVQACQLDDYLRKVHASGEAVRQIVARLEDIERATGRGYVVMIFGDHQPHTFTKTGLPVESPEVYDDHRRTPDNRLTFFHILSSLQNPLAAKFEDEAVPLHLLPTLLSAYAARDVSEMYLPLNLMVHARCGADILHPPALAKRDEASAASSPCPSTSELVGGVRAAGVLSFD